MSLKNLAAGTVPFAYGMSWFGTVNCKFCLDAIDPKESDSGTVNLLGSFGKYTDGYLLRYVKGFANGLGFVTVILLFQIYKNRSKTIHIIVIS